MMRTFDGPARDPLSQFQIGDVVIYLPEGVVTKISGYSWYQSVGTLPKIAGYSLACGIVVPENTIARHP